VRTLYQNETLMAGKWYKTLWDGENDLGQTAASDVYFYRLAAGFRISVKKMILIK